MNDIPVTVPDPVSRFYDNYLKRPAKRSIPEKRRAWYVRRVEDFIKAQNGRKIKQLSRQDINRYFAVIGRENGLEGWQFLQCIDAIRILYCDLLRSRVCSDVDWQYWKGSARQLEIDHPSTARQYTPEQLNYLKRRAGDGAVNQVRSQHRELILRFTREIRRRGYAYRTEQSYEQ